MKALTLIFVVLIALLQYPLWLGKGSWLRVWDLSHQLSQQQKNNNALKARNDTLDAEVRDLKSGRAAIEERARSELGMVKQDEVFYQVLEGPMPVIVPPPIAPIATKADTPIIVSVPSKNAVPKNSPKSAVTQSPMPKDSAGKTNDSTGKNSVVKDSTFSEKPAKEKPGLLLQPANPLQLTEPAPAAKTQEKAKVEEKSKDENRKKVKPGNDAVEAAKAVLKQQ